MKKGLMPFKRRKTTTGMRTVNQWISMMRTMRRMMRRMKRRWRKMTRKKKKARMS